MGYSKNRLALILILGFSAAMGLVCVLQMHNSPFGQKPVVDEKGYVEWAGAIASGDIVGEKIFYQAPLYPYFLGLCLWLSRGSLLFARLVQAGLGVITVYLVFLLGRRMFGEREGILSALILALYGVFYFYTAILIKASLVITLSALSCLLAVVAVDSSGLRFWLGLGITLGLLILLRGNFLVLVPFVIVWALAVNKDLVIRTRVIRTLVLIAGIAVCIAPVSFRNYLISEQFVLTTSQGGQNFYIGNSPHATGSYVHLPFVRPDPRWEAVDFLAEAERRTGLPLKLIEASRFWYGESIRYLMDSPWKAIRLQLHKTRLMFHAYEIPDNYNYSFMRQTFMPVLWLGFIGYGMLLGPALLGMVFSMGREPRTWYPIIFSVFYAFSVIAFFVVSRYRVAVVPVLVVFSAHFLCLAMNWLKAKSAKSLSLAAVVLVVITLFAYLPTPESGTSYAVSYNLTGTALNGQGAHDLAVEYLNKAVALEPNSYYMLYNLAVALLNKGDPAEAVEYFRKADRLKPDNFQILSGLAVAFRRLGDGQKAQLYYERAGKLKDRSGLK